MDQANFSLKKIILLTLATVFLACTVVAYLHARAQERQARRVLIYLQARELAAQEQQKRAADYQKRLQQERLTRQYNRGVQY